MGDPFGQDFAGTAALGDTKGKDAGFERVFHAWHWADQWQSIGGIGDRPVDHAGHAGRAQQRYALHRVGYDILDTVKIVVPKLKAEIIGHGVVWCGPMRTAIWFIWTKVKAMLFLPQVIRHIHITQQWQFMTDRFGMGFDFGDFLGQQILMAHHHHGDRAATIRFEPFADALGVIACGVDHIIGVNVALFGVHNPRAIVVLCDTRRGGKAQDFRAHITRTFGQSLGQLRGINVTVVGVIQCAHKVMCFDKWIAFFDLVRC